MSELLFEIFSEEIPARMQFTARQQLRDIATKELSKAGIKFKMLEAFVSPRRLVLHVQDLSIDETGDEFIYKKGPAVDEQDEVIEAFAAELSVSRENLITKEIKSKQYYFARQAKVKTSLNHLLKQILERLMQEFSWPKSMRWDESNITWVRPIRNILCLLDEQVLPIQYGNLIANDLSFGHRFLSPASFQVKNFREYSDALQKAKVMLSYEARKAEIQAQTSNLLALLNAQVIQDDALLDEVCGLVEDPHVLLGQMSANFLALPAPVIITAMRRHQKYFSLQDKNGKLLPHFIVVANIPSLDDTIVKGNQRVLTARLSDAKFLFDEDRKSTLESHVANLEKIVYHQDLDTMLDKVHRLEQLAPHMAASCPVPVDLDVVKRAAKLAKADLATNLVKEFPELQGVIGQCYAQLDGEPEAVVKAIGEHYLPQGKDDELPRTIESALIALADKFDNLVGLFFVCGAPTSSKDPYALRRQALGIVRILCAFDISVDADQIIQTCLELIGAVHAESLVTQILEFLYGRFKFHLKDAFKPDLIEAVLNTSRDDVASDYKKLQCLEKFMSSQDGLYTFQSIKRTLNIADPYNDPSDYMELVIKWRIKDSFLEGTLYDQKLDLELMNSHEKKLLEAIKITASAIPAMLNDHAGILKSFFELSKIINDFFDKVLIMDEDLKVRASRLALLRNASALFLGLADFSCIKI